MILRVKLKNWINNIFLTNYDIVPYSIYVLGLAGIVGHPVYWLLWTYIDPKQESAYLRIIGFVTSLALILYKFCPKNLVKFIPTYWFFAIAYNLPFIFTTLFIMNDFSLQWSCAMVGMIVFSSMLLPNLFLLLLNMMLGVMAAILYCMIFNNQIVTISDNFYLTYMPVFGFAIFIGYAFSYCNTKGIAVKTKINLIKSLSGSIAHELRNPLSAINLIGDQIKDVLSKDINDSTKKELCSLTTKISESIVSANSIINMILSDLSEKPISPQDFSYYKLSQIMPNIIDRYGYKTLDEKSKVKLNITPENDFIFKSIEQRFTFIIYNLLKNSLYYLKQFPNSIVEIGTEKKLFTASLTTRFIS